MGDDPERAALEAYIQSAAEKTFGNRTKASLWLRRPLASLEGQTPLEVAQTEAGARLIDKILGKIAWGAAG